MSDGWVRRAALAAWALAVTAFVLGFVTPFGARSGSSQSGRVAFYVRGSAHVSEGSPTPIEYETVTNLGNGWHAPSTFRAPVSGLYYLTVEFVKDAFHHGGTEDDVFVYIQVHTPPASPTIQARAFSGQDSGKRELGAAAMVVHLVAGTTVRTLAHSDGAPPKKRHIAAVNFSGFLVD